MCIVADDAERQKRETTNIGDCMMKCVLCNDEIKKEPITGWAGGHNAEPLAQGQCCRDCNDDKVIPARIENIRSAFEKGMMT